MISVPNNVPDVEQMGAGECTITCAAAAIAERDLRCDWRANPQGAVSPENVLEAIKASRA